MPRRTAMQPLRNRPHAEGISRRLPPGRQEVAAQSTPAGSNVRNLVLRSREELFEICGVKTEDVAKRLLTQVMSLLDSPLNEQAGLDALASAVGLLRDLEPRTATEALLAVQMIGVHQAAIVFLRRSLLVGQTPEGMDANVSRVTRLMRLFNDQLEARARLKGKVPVQRVVVERVTVNQGGQAIVGALANSNPRGPGEG